MLKRSALLWFVSIGYPLAAQQVPLYETSIENREVIVIPDLDQLESRQHFRWTIDDLEFQVETGPTHVRYTVELPYRTYTHYESAADPRVRLAYDRDSQRLRRVLPSLQIKLNDYDKLDDLVLETKATRGKAFPVLDFAILYFDSTQDIVMLKQSVEQIPNVTSVSLMLEPPLQVPH